MLSILDKLGVLVFAISGALAGLRLGLDLFGVTVLAAVTSVGGGTVRDVLINRHPVAWIADPTYLYVIFAATLLAILGAHVLPNLPMALLVADAMGLGLFAITGAQAFETKGYAWIVVISLGTLGAVAGGVIRDVLSGMVPLLLRRDIYATAAIGGILFYLILQRLGMTRRPASVIAILAIVATRILAIEFNWQLPVFPLAAN